MQENGTRKRLGRFFKHSDKLIQKISIAKYSFEEISRSNSLFPDNTRGNIFHARLHHVSELEKAILPPDKFDDSLLDENHRMPVIFPRDFTEEWLRDKRRWKRREDGDLEEDLEEEYHNEEKTVFESKPSKKKPPQVAVETAAEKAAKSAQTAVADKEASSPKPDDKLKMVGQVIKEAAFHDIQDKKPTKEQEATNVQDKEPAQPKEVAAEANAPFIPLDLKNPSGLSNEEDSAIKKYHQKIEDQKEEQKKADIQAAAELEIEKKKGFEKGFEDGVEKGKEQVKEEAAEIFGRVNEIISELAKLKTNVLNSIEDNFYELNQAIAEALLNREFNISKDAFTAVLKKALSETAMNDEFKVKVHPETYDKMISLDIKELKNNLVKDESVKPGEFKIDSKLSSVKGNVKDIVSNLLDSMEVNLFEKHDKAS